MLLSVFTAGWLLGRGSDVGWSNAGRSGRAGAGFGRLRIEDLADLPDADRDALAPHRPPVAVPVALPHPQRDVRPAVELAQGDPQLLPVAPGDRGEPEAVLPGRGGRVGAAHGRGPLASVG